MSCTTTNVWSACAGSLLVHTWRGSRSCVPWLTCICGIWLMKSYATLMCAMTHMWATSGVHTWRGSHVSHGTHEHICHIWRGSSSCVPWLTCICGILLMKLLDVVCVHAVKLVCKFVTRSHVTWRILICDMIHSYMWHDSYSWLMSCDHTVKRVCTFVTRSHVTWCTLVCDMIHSDMWHDTCSCLMSCDHTVKRVCKFVTCLHVTGCMSTCDMTYIELKWCIQLQNEARV